jgi:hypothetical protein
MIYDVMQRCVSASVSALDVRRQCLLWLQSFRTVTQPAAVHPGGCAGCVTECQTFPTPICRDLEFGLDGLPFHAYGDEVQVGFLPIRGRPIKINCSMA